VKVCPVCHSPLVYVVQERHTCVNWPHAEPETYEAGLYCRNCHAKLLPCQLIEAPSVALTLIGGSHGQ